VYIRGKRIADVTMHPLLRTAIDHASIDYLLAEQAGCRSLAVVDGDSRFFHPPQNVADLMARSQLIEEATRQGGTLVTLIKEIGTDALFALLVVAEQLGGEYPARVRRYLAACREGDLAMAVAQTDVKGDRALSPAQQPNPDAYLHVVERRADGIVVRGTKCHTSVSVNANELIVLPTRQMGPADRDFALAFAIPVDTVGLKLIVSPYLGGHDQDGFERPLASRHKMIETTTLFENVFVPWDRVFLCGEWQQAGPIARTFVEFHRFTAVSYKLPLLDAFVGGAIEMARMNGIEKAGHVRDKLAWLVSYVETVRGLLRQAAAQCRYVEAPGVAIPNPLLVNIAKLHFAQGYHTALQHVQDITGGILVTGPSVDDLDNREYGPTLERAYGGASGADGRTRLRMAKLMAELTTSDFGGYQAALAIHAEGSIEAEKLIILREYNPQSATDYVRSLVDGTH
jgi:aromatic ring hydroxylase